MAKQAYDRIKNANNQSDAFIQTQYWTPAIEDSFDAWAADQGEQGLADLVDDLLSQDVAVSFKQINGSICCTLAHQPSKAANMPYLLTGWSDGCLDAMYVARYKFEVELKGIWTAPPTRAPSRRH